MSKTESYRMAYFENDDYAYITDMMLELSPIQLKEMADLMQYASEDDVDLDIVASGVTLNIYPIFKELGEITKRASDRYAEENPLTQNEIKCDELDALGDKQYDEMKAEKAA